MPMSGGTISEVTARCVNPVIVATRSVFETMLDITPRRSGLSLNDELVPSHELSAVIGITGQLLGTVVLSLSESAAIGVYNAMLDQKVTQVNNDVCDAVAELTNMIAGAAKSQLEGLGLQISIPNIVSGRSFRILYPSRVTPVCIAYESDIGPLTVEVGFAWPTDN